MPGKRDDNVKNLTVEILKQIRAELSGLRGEMRDEIGGLREEQKSGFRELRDRFDHLLEFAGDRYRNHERRIRALERHVAPPRPGK